MRAFHHSAFPPARLARAGRPTVSVCVPARNELPTIAPIVRCLVELKEQHVIDQVVVVDDSSDGTGERARALGAEVYRQADLFPEYGPVRGKGDAMWRALAVLDGELVCYVDADSGHFGPHYVAGLIGPLCDHADIQFVKGYYRRPFRAADVADPRGGGRVTELMARPLLSLFYPELAGVRQPLAGEIAARADLLRALPFSTGYAVDIGLLIDAWKAVGPAALAQVDLDVRQNAHQSLDELGPMAYAVLRAVADRLAREGRLDRLPPLPFVGARGERQDVVIVERPPHDACAAELRRTA